MGCASTKASHSTAARLETDGTPRPTLLVCASWLPPALIAELKQAFEPVTFALPGRVTECRRALLAADGVDASGCLDRGGPCALPSFVNGEPTATRDAGYELLLLLDRLRQSATDARASVTRISPVGAREANPYRGQPDATGVRLPDAQFDVDRAVRGPPPLSPEAATLRLDSGLTGPVYLFRPRQGELLRARRVNDADARTIRSVIGSMLDSIPGVAGDAHP